MTELEDRPAFAQKRFEPPPGSCQILLVRHGASQPLVAGETFPLIDGQGDPGLAPNGVEQAEVVARRLEHEPIAAIYTSSMRRTHQTAAPLVRRLGLEPVVDADLREVHLGDWEGGLLRQRAAEGDPLYARVVAERRWDVIPNAEPDEVFASRTSTAVERIASRHPDEVVAVFCHGGVIGALCAHATGGESFAFAGADNCSISHIVVTPDHWVLRRFNDSTHLYPRVSLPSSGSA